MVPGTRANMLSMVKAIDRGLFFLVGRNENVKSLVSIGNVAAAVGHLLPRAGPGCAVFNLVDRESYTVRAIAGMIATGLGKKPPRSLPASLAWLGAEAGEVLRRVGGVGFPLTRARLRALLETTHFSSEKLVSAGFLHAQSTSEGIAEMVGWYREKEQR